MDVPRKSKRTRRRCLFLTGSPAPASQGDAEAREGVLAGRVALRSRKHWFLSLYIDVSCLPGQAK